MVLIAFLLFYSKSNSKVNEIENFEKIKLYVENQFLLPYNNFFNKLGGNNIHGSKIYSPFLNRSSKSI